MFGVNVSVDFDGAWAKRREEPKIQSTGNMEVANDEAERDIS